MNEVEGTFVTEFNLLVPGLFVVEWKRNENSQSILLNGFAMGYYINSPLPSNVPYVILLHHSSDKFLIVSYGLCHIILRVY